MRFEPITREQFVREPRIGADKFAATFASKADAMKLWPFVSGFVHDDGHIMAAICVRVTTRGYPVANLQLLHTFSAHRNRGLATSLVLDEYERIVSVADYFRVSSEHDAVGFYRSLGLKFWGRQKSGSLLCIHRIESTVATIADGAYDQEDPTINKLLFSGRRGSLVEEFDQPW